MASIPEALVVAIQHHHAGRLSTAERVYRQILDVEPNHAEALHGLGVCLAQSGRHASAADFIEQAISLVPKSAQFHCSLGNVRQCQGLMDAAIVSYREALRLQPKFAEALNNLANALKFQGELAEAINTYQRALELQPNWAEAHYNLGNAYREQGEFTPAIRCYQRALSLRPNYPEAYNNLGNALQSEGKLSEAVQAFQSALRLQPGYVVALNNLGNAYRLQGNLKDAVHSYEQAVRLKPDYVEAHNHLGNALRDLGQFDSAAASYERALQLRPEYLPALGHLVDTRQRMCCWTDLPDLSRRIIARVENEWAGSNEPLSPLTFLTLHTPTTGMQQLMCALSWSKATIGSGRSKTGQETNDRPTTDVSTSAPEKISARSKLRIGYLSGDFRAHPVAYLVAGLLENHNRDRFTIIGYSCGPDDGSEIRQRLIRSCDRFVDVRAMSHLDAARTIVADNVDILVDLSGYTQHARPEILALRPAPIQVSYLGYPGTMGVSFIDYLLVDEFVVPQDQEPSYTERLVHLPGCYQVNDRCREVASDVPTRTACGLPEHGFVFCCFNNSYKITAEMFDVWMELLRLVPDSVLWLTESNRFVPANLRREAQARGVSPDRLVFSPALPMPEYLARYRLADLFLDTFPYNAGATASDALWMGCPVLTLAGETFVSRMAGSLLTALELPELITTSLDDYRDLALSLAGDSNRLADLRTRLAENVEIFPVFDASLFASRVEHAFQQMWQTHQPS